MSSEYLTWLARNEKPETPRELTPKERRANWWHYNKWFVVLALAAAALGVFLVRDIVRNVKSTPDCQVGYIGAEYLSDETVLALEEQLALLIGDLDGNGTAIVQVNQYLSSTEDPSQKMLLGTHLTAGVNSMFLLDDPAAFHQDFGMLSLPDGSEPQPGGTESLWYRWADCPKLAALPLEAHLSDLFVARTYHSDRDTEQQYTAAWQNLIGK